MKAVFLLGCYGCIFHGTGNSAQLCQNFGISGRGGGGFEPPQTLPRYATVSHQVSRCVYAVSPYYVIRSPHEIKTKCGAEAAVIFEILITV